MHDIITDVAMENITYSDVMSLRTKYFQALIDDEENIIPPLILRSQIYATAPNKGVVDKELVLYVISVNHSWIFKEKR